MKLIILLTAAALASAAKLDKTYLPPSSAQTAGGDFLDTPNFGSADAFHLNEQGGNRYYEGNFDYHPERTQAAFESNAAILRQDNVNNGDSYSYGFETENGIVAEESGVATNGVEAQGGFSYIGDDGKQYSIRYTADQNGFQPQGDHLPTSPPIPEEILKALEQNARDEAAGIFDDGSYNEAKYESYNRENYGNYETKYTVDPFSTQTQDDSIITDSAAFQKPNYYEESGNPSLTKAYLPPRYNNGY